MKIIFSLLVCSIFLFGCVAADHQRTFADVNELASNHDEFDEVRFVVSANCDYDAFFKGAAMRNGGFIAYGYKDGNPKLLVIPKVDSYDAEIVNWPMRHRLNDILNLLNEVYEDAGITLDYLYENTRFELTYNLLGLDRIYPYDLAFFVVISINGKNHVAIENNAKLYIYHQDIGFLISND